MFCAGVRAELRLLRAVPGQLPHPRGCAQTEDQGACVEVYAREQIPLQLQDGVIGPRQGTRLSQHDCLHFENKQHACMDWFISVHTCDLMNAMFLFKIGFVTVIFLLKITDSRVRHRGTFGDALDK